MPNANSLVLPLPMTTAPASRRRATATASAVGSRDQPLDPAVVGMPATWMTSLTQIGMPASGPALPSSSAASARRAAASAPSRSTYR
jgi:hypothetical protein